MGLFSSDPNAKKIKELKKLLATQKELEATCERNLDRCPKDSPNRGELEEMYADAVVERTNTETELIQLGCLDF